MEREEEKGMGGNGNAERVLFYVTIYDLFFCLLVDHSITSLCQ